MIGNQRPWGREVDVGFSDLAILDSMLPRRCFSDERLTSFVQILVIYFKGWYVPLKTLCAFSRMSQCQFFFKLQSRVLLTLKALMDTKPQKLFAPLKSPLQTYRVVAKFGFRRPSEVVLAQVASSSCAGGWAQGSGFMGRTKLFMSKAEGVSAFRGRRNCKGIGIEGWLWWKEPTSCKSQLALDICFHQI